MLESPLRLVLHMIYKHESRHASGTRATRCTKVEEQQADDPAFLKHIRRNDMVRRILNYAFHAIYK